MWRFGPVRRLLLSNLVLYAGVALQAAALGKQAFDITGREADIGFIGLAEFLPAALLVLVTGSVADRFDRKRGRADRGVRRAAVLRRAARLRD